MISILKIGGGILILVAIAVGILSVNKPVGDTVQKDDLSGAQSEQYVQDSAMAISSRDSSDASLDADTALIDSELNSLNSDSSAVDEGFNDKPISQTE